MRLPRGRISRLFSKARDAGVNHPLDALSIASNGMVLPRCEHGIDVHAAIRVLRRFNMRLQAKEAETFATDIDALVAFSGLDSAWQYTRYALGQHSLKQLVWPEHLRAVASCSLCGRRFEDAIKASQCRRCGAARSNQSAVLHWLIEAVPDRRRRALRALIGLCALLGVIYVSFIITPH